MLQITCPPCRARHNANYHTRGGDEMNAVDQKRLPEAPGAAGIYRIWPGEGRAPDTEGWTHRESTMQIPWTTASRRMASGMS